MITIKRGDTFSQAGEWALADGTAISLVDKAVTCSIVAGLPVAKAAFSETFRAALTVTVTDAAAGEFTITGNTTSWPITRTIDGRLLPTRAFLDVKVSGTGIDTSGTVRVEIEERVT